MVGVDSLLVHQWLSQDPTGYPKAASLIRSCKKIVCRDWLVQINHIFWERNKVVDCLAARLVDLPKRKLEMWNSPSVLVLYSNRRSRVSGGQEELEFWIYTCFSGVLYLMQKKRKKIIIRNWNYLKNFKQNLSTHILLLYLFMISIGKLILKIILLNINL